MLDTTPNKSFKSFLYWKKYGSKGGWVGGWVVVVVVVVVLCVGEGLLTPCLDSNFETSLGRSSHHAMFLPLFR